MKRKWLLALSLIAIVATFTTAGFLLQSPASAQTFAVSVSGLHVSGNQLLNSSNQVVRPLGVDRSGTEYMCDSAGSTTVLDGPSDATSVNAMLSWNINAVRVPLNEDCWLGINGYPAAQYSAAAYQQAIVNYVNLLTANHLIVILDLHWSAPGTQQANKQLPMPDAAHAPAFWTSVANTFKSNSSVIFDLYNEPFTTSWSCWLNGSSAANASPCGDVGFAVAGMQTLVNTVRATGATNVLMLGGLAYSNDLSQWLQFKPNDPLNNLVASFHVYNFNACSNASCWNAQVAPVAAVVPVIAGEMGENDCQSGFINSVMSWLDQHNIGYLGWAWNADFNCSSGPGLISNYDGTPTQFGLGLKNHLAALAGGGGSTPTPGTTPTPRTTPTPGTTPTPITTPTPTPTSGSSCRVSYTVQNQWQGGFTTNITITNTGSTAINGWTLAFTFPGNQQVVQGWSGTFTQQGSNVTVRNLSYNGSLAPGSSTSFGFNGSWSGSNSSPTSFTLNGARCS